MKRSKNIDIPEPKAAEKKIISELEKAKTYSLLDMIKYTDRSVVIKSIFNKPTGTITIMSFDIGQGMEEKNLPFDSFAHILDGTANIIIDRKSTILKTGESIIIPANTPHSIKPDTRFKMLLMIIKSGYEL